MGEQGEMIVEFLPIWKENILRAVARCLGIKGIAVGFIHYQKRFDDNEPTINDIKRNEEESQMNRKEDNGDDILKP
jgi:hypothetical protein